MRRLPIRVRLTAAFALAMIAVLVGAAAFVYSRLDSDLTETVDEGLTGRAAAVASADADAGAPVEAEEGFAQVIAPDGRLLDSAGGAADPVLSEAEIERASAAPIVVERQVPGVAGEARVLARPDAGAVIAVGQSLEDRDETLASVLASFAIGGTIAVVLASLIGYALATAGLRPVEAMRRRAGQVSLDRSGELLPLPAARDEVRRLGETLNEMLERLRASFERERRLVADASHELRTPIAIIRAELDGALRAGDCGPEARAALVRAIEECDRLAQLAEDLLVIARIAEGGLPVSPEPLDVTDLLEATRARFAGRAAEHGREIRIASGPGLVLDADPLRLRQALGNLVDNALRHGEGEIVLGAAERDGAIDIDVSDAGPGFDPTVVGRAFERFTRGDESRTTGGAGLGLTLVRAIAQAHGANAEIVPGRPTTVRMRFPRSQEPLSGRS